PKIPRTSNAFFLYRKQRNEEFKHQHKGKKKPTQAELNKIWADDWRRESPAVLRHFAFLAEQAAVDQQHKHPHYKYQPRQPK
ncbi:hypothetical protein BC940DRAFT_217502, partial [Gongronella butleri]